MEVEIAGHHVEMLFVDDSSTFNTTIPSKLATKLEDLGFSSSETSHPIDTGVPQGCVLSPLLYSLDSYNRGATSSSTTAVVC